MYNQLFIIQQTGGLLSMSLSMIGNAQRAGKKCQCDEMDYDLYFLYMYGA